jgi:hypothetical protein
MAFPAQGGYYLPLRHRRAGGAAGLNTPEKIPRGEFELSRLLFAVVGSFMAANLLG